MESHVSGGITPLSIGELRRDLLAVLIGNRLFNQAEQLLANHHAHECNCPQRLALWLRNVRREAERREHIIAVQAQACQQGGGSTMETQVNELQQLAHCQALTQRERQSIDLLPMEGASSLGVISLVGIYYVTALRRAGKLREYGA